MPRLDTLVLDIEFVNQIVPVFWALGYVLEIYLVCKPESSTAVDQFEDEDLGNDPFGKFKPGLIVCVDVFLGP